MPVTARIIEAENDRTGRGILSRKKFLVVQQTDDEDSKLTYCYRPFGDVHGLIRARLAAPPKE